MADSPDINIDWSDYTEKQIAAITHYLKHGEKFPAYQAAYDCSNMKVKTARRACYNFFNLPKIKLIVDQIQTEAIRKAKLRFEDIERKVIQNKLDEYEAQVALEIDAAWVIKRAAVLAEFNIKKFLKKDTMGMMYYDFSEATDDDWYCIQEYSADEISKNTKGGRSVFQVDRIRLKTPDKLRALELIGRCVNAFAPDSDIPPTGVNIVINRPTPK